MGDPAYLSNGNWKAEEQGRLIAIEKRTKKQNGTPKNPLQVWVQVYDRQKRMWKDSCRTRFVTASHRENDGYYRSVSDEAINWTKLGKMRFKILHHNECKVQHVEIQKRLAKLQSERARAEFRKNIWRGRRRRLPESHRAFRDILQSSNN